MLKYKLGWIKLCEAFLQFDLSFFQLFSACFSKLYRKSVCFFKKYPDQSHKQHYWLQIHFV